MPITFRCEKCRSEIKAPDSAGGKRGKCPHCGHSSMIPSPDREEIPLAPLDEKEEQIRQEELEALKEQERALLREMGGQEAVPLEQKENLTSQDLHHYVVNYCLDMLNGRLERAEHHVKNMKKFKYTAVQAVEEFQTGKAKEPAMDAIPKKVLQGFLLDLKERLRSPD